MFWEKWLNKANSNTPQKPKLRSPGEIPHQIGRHLVVNLQKNPDWVWNLKAALKPVEGGKKSARLVRIFDPEQAANRGVRIHNYETLDNYPELILYEGNFDKESNAVSLVAMESNKAA